MAANLLGQSVVSCGQAIHVRWCGSHSAGQQNGIGSSSAAPIAVLPVVCSVTVATRCWRGRGADGRTDFPGNFEIMRKTPLILIVDEDEAFVSATHAGLESAGYAVTTADSGPAALESATRLKPNLVIVEMILPGCSGFRVLREMNEPSQMAPVVMVASFGGFAQRVLAESMGAAEFLCKPVSLNRLVEIAGHLMPRQAPLNPPHFSSAVLKSVNSHAGP